MTVIPDPSCARPLPSPDPDVDPERHLIRRVDGSWTHLPPRLWTAFWTLHEASGLVQLGPAVWPAMMPNYADPASVMRRLIYDLRQCLKGSRYIIQRWQGCGEELLVTRYPSQPT